MQFGYMVRRGYYPAEDERLTGAMLLSPAQDALSLFLETEEFFTAVAGEQVKSRGGTHQEYSNARRHSASLVGPTL